MSINSGDKRSDTGGKVCPDKTDWKRVIAQSDAQISQSVQSDPDSPVLKNKKYYKPEKSARS